MNFWVKFRFLGHFPLPQASGDPGRSESISWCLAISSKSKGLVTGVTSPRKPCPIAGNSILMYKINSQTILVIPCWYMLIFPTSAFVWSIPHPPSPSPPPQDWSQLQSNAAQLSERQLQPLLRLAEQVTKASAVWYNVSGTKTCWQMSQEVRRLLWMVDILIYPGIIYIYIHA